MRDLRHLAPSHVVLDQVLQWADTIGRDGTACVKNGTMIMTTHNHLGNHVMLGVQVHFDGEPDDEAPRFVLRRLGPTVWKLSPSVLDQTIHAYVTLVGVPDPAPWESRGGT